MNQNDVQPARPAVSKWLWITLGTVLVIAAGFFTWWFLMGPGKSEPATVSTPTPVTTPTTTKPTSTTQDSTDLTYTNSTYGFTLTFPASWKGYKFKEASYEGSTITYYAQIPSSDTMVNSAGMTNDSGYYSPFAITVYTLAQWDNMQNSEGPNETLITKNDKYAFVWSQANGMPPSDIGTKLDDIKAIIASFKLS